MANDKVFFADKQTGKKTIMPPPAYGCGGTKMIPNLAVDYCLVEYCPGGYCPS